MLAAAIALGLADNRHDVGRADRSARDQPIEFGEIPGMRHRQSENLRRLHGTLALRVNSNNRLGLSGISSSSTLWCLRSSASSIACANNGPTGIAPPSPAPLIPSGLSGDGVVVWPSSIRGASS